MTKVVVEYRPSLHNPPRRSPLIFGGLTFVPGVRGYSKELWDELQKQKAIASVIETLLSEGIFRVISDTANNGSPMLPANNGVAIALIEKTFSVELLTSWRGAENREVILKAIDKQLAKGQEKPPNTTDKELAKNTPRTKKASEVFLPGDEESK